MQFLVEIRDNPDHSLEYRIKAALAIVQLAQAHKNKSRAKSSTFTVARRTPSQMAADEASPADEPAPGK